MPGVERAPSAHRRLSACLALMFHAIEIKRPQCDADAGTVVQNAAKHHEFSRDRPHRRSLQQFIHAGDWRRVNDDFAKVRNCLDQQDPDVVVTEPSSDRSKVADVIPRLAVVPCQGSLPALLHMQIAVVQHGGVDLLALTAEMRERLVTIANGQDRYVCVPLQGVGNTANEATLGTLVPRERRLLIVSNGFYGERLKQIAEAIGLPFEALDLPWTEPAGDARLDRALAADGTISHVAVCHVDTGTGLLNRLEPLAEVAKRRGVALIVDAIASFGGLPIDAEALDLEALVASPNKWLEGVPGIGLVLIKRAALEKAAGRAHSFCLDLHRQWRSFEHDGRWRFTPPTQATAALVAALRQHAEEGQAKRLERVRRNWRCLVDGLRELGSRLSARRGRVARDRDVS